MIITRAEYFGRKGVDESTFEAIKQLVLTQPGTTAALNDVIVFDVPASGIMRPGNYTSFEVELGTRGESISVKARNESSTLARYDSKHKAGFECVYIKTFDEISGQHLLRRDNCAFSDVSALLDRTTHTILCDNKPVKYTFQTKWVYPYTDDKSGTMFLGRKQYEIFVDFMYSISASNIIDILAFNTPGPYNQFVLCYRSF